MKRSYSKFHVVINKDVWRGIFESSKRAMLDFSRFFFKGGLEERHGGGRERNVLSFLVSGNSNHSLIAHGFHYLGISWKETKSNF